MWKIGTNIMSAIICLDINYTIKSKEIIFVCFIENIIV